MSTTPTITWSDGHLVRDGKPYRMLAGGLHYFRVHPELWEDRLRRLRAMGANTVDTYVAWNFHEETEGEFRFDGWHDLERFIRIAGEVGLDVFLRPSPFICAEWSNGGLPAWFTGRVAAVRTSDPEYLAAVERWYDELIPRMVPLQAANGGPIVAVQVENEYGSFGSDRAYMEHQHDALRSRGIVELLTTADGTTSDMQVHGSVEGALPTFTFGTGVKLAEELRRPEDALMCSELWGGWFDHWGENHHVRSAQSMIGTVDELLAAGGSVSVYMAHGGTNFGLWAGANHGDVLEPTVTSYDSDAPIGEGGALGPKFEALRKSFAPFNDGELPEPPAPAAMQPVQSVALEPVVGLREFAEGLAPVGSSSPMPQTFEQLGVGEGVVVYQASIDVPADATLTVDGLHDRAVAYLDGERVATLQRDGEVSFTVPGGGRQAELTLVVENLGRINYGPRIGEHKGILGGVRVNGRRYVHGWSHRALYPSAPDLYDGIPNIPEVRASAPSRPEVRASAPSRPEVRAERASKGTPDGVALATVDVETPADAWLAFPGSGKGMVWLNGFLLGRYWKVGPQESLYAPAPLWKSGANEIVVLEMDELGSTVEVRDEPSFGPTEEFIGS